MNTTSPNSAWQRPRALDRRAILHRSALALGAGVTLAAVPACATDDTDSTQGTTSPTTTGSTIVPPTTAPASALPEPVSANLDTAMRAAITEAESAPWAFGAVLVSASDGTIVASAANDTDSGDPSAHAEVEVLRKAGLAGTDLTQTVLVTTAESCPMCAACEVWAGVAGVAYGTSISYLTAAGFDQIDISSPTVIAAGYVPMPVVADVLRSETDPLYTDGPPQ